MKQVELSDIEQQVLRNLITQVTAARAAVCAKEAEAKTAREQAAEAETKLNTALAVIAQLHGFTGGVRLSPDGRALEGE